MILAICGYAKTGKTLLFNILTGQHESVSKFSLPTGEFHKAVVDVPDDRLEKVAKLHGQPGIFAKIEFLDTGAVAFGTAKDAAFWDLIRRADGLVHLVRGFQDPEILHLPGEIDPVRDMRLMEEELRTADFFSLEKRLEKLALDVKKMKSKDLEEELALLKKMSAFLEGGKPLREFTFFHKEEAQVRGYRFISQKPILHLVNSDETTYHRYAGLAKPPSNKNAVGVFAGKIEKELLELDSELRAEFQKEYRLDDYHYIREEFVRTSYGLLDLISFFTLGKEETKAWTIEKGMNAYDAAGKIHSDIQHGFIRAEVIPWQDFLTCGGLFHAKEKGLLRLEGKDYVIRDGDVIHFRFHT